MMRRLTLLLTTEFIADDAGTESYDRRTAAEHVDGGAKRLKICLTELPWWQLTWLGMPSNRVRDAF